MTTPSDSVYADGMASPDKELADIFTRVVRALRAAADADARERTVLLHEAAVAFVDARKLMPTRDFDPDWLGRTKAYRDWVRGVFLSAGIPNETRATVQAAIRYHVQDILRERLPSETLTNLGLVTTSPSARRAVRRGHNNEILSMFGAGERLTDTERIVPALGMVAGALRRVSVEAVSELPTPEKAKVRAAIAEVSGLADAISGASVTK